MYKSFNPKNTFYEETRIWSKNETILNVEISLICTNSLFLNDFKTNWFIKGHEFCKTTWM